MLILLPLSVAFRLLVVCQFFDYSSFVSCLELIQFQFLSIILNVSFRFRSLAPRSEGGESQTNRVYAGVSVNVSFVSFRFVSFCFFSFCLFLHSTKSSVHPLTSSIFSLLVALLTLLGARGGV